MEEEAIDLEFLCFDFELFDIIDILRSLSYSWCYRVLEFLVVKIRILIEEEEEEDSAELGFLGGERGK